MGVFAVTTDASVQEKPRPRYTGHQIFPIVASIVFAISALLWWPVLAAGPTVLAAGPPVRLDSTQLLVGSGILLLAFLAGELFPLQIEVRRETLLVSGSELPMVLGLLLLPAWIVGVTHAAAGLLVFLIRRDSGRNIAVNLSFITVETGTAAAVAMALSNTDSSLGAQYLAVAIGVLAGALMSAASVGLTYRLIGPAEPLGRFIGRAMLAAAAIVTFALVGLTVWQSSSPPEGMLGPVLCLVLATVLSVLYRTYFLFLRQHADLTRMYTFGRQVTGVGSSTADWRGVLEQVRDQLNAEVAVLRLGDGDREQRTLAIGPDGLLDEPAAAVNDPLLALARMTGRARVSSDRTSDLTLLSALKGRKAWDVLVVPLRSGDRVVVG